jgi:hypothetical protein
VPRGHVRRMVEVAEVVEEGSINHKKPTNQRPASLLAFWRFGTGIYSHLDHLDHRGRR